MTAKKTVRIGCGQGFWGDYIDAPDRIVKDGKLDYLILDYLAEVTMSVLAKQYERDPSKGYASDFPPLIGRLAQTIKNNGLKVIANAGGVNPRAAAEKVREVLKQTLGSDGDKIKIGVVYGDNVKDLLNEHLKQGKDYSHLDSGQALSTIFPKVKSANAYIGSESLVRALEDGASIVIVGRVADPCMCVAPLIYEFAWDQTDWNLISSGIIAGHIIECGAQASGGNFSFGWKDLIDPVNIGFPIVEFDELGDFIVTKSERSAGIVSCESVTEQLVYEIGDPKEYITPDVIADFTSLNLTEIRPNEVKVSGCKGRMRPSQLKVSISYADGYMADGTLVIVGPDVKKKAAICEQIVRSRIKELGLTYDELLFERLGCFSIPGLEETLNYPEPGEIVFRAAMRGQEEASIKKFTRELAPLVLSGPPGITAYSGGKRDIKEIFSYFPTLIDRKLVNCSWEIF